MPRQPRIDYPGAIHHVTNRGQNRQDVYLDDNDRCDFLEHLGSAAREFRIKVLAFVLMSNHYHLLIQSLDNGLSDAMQLLGGRYTQDFNRRHSRDGSLFKGRFFSKLIEDERHVLEAARYIPNNPVKAGLVQRAEDYPWSSYPATLGGAPSPNFLAPSAIVDEHFGGNTVAFDAFVRERGTRQTALFAHVIEGDRPEPHLADAIIAVEVSVERVTTCPVRNPGLLPIRDELFRFVCTRLDVTMLQIGSPRFPSERDARLLLLALLHRHEIASLEQLASAFGYSHKAGALRTIRRFEDRAANDPRLGATLHEGLALLAVAA